MKWLIALAAVLLLAAPASAQIRVELGGTGTLANDATDDEILIGNGTAFVEDLLADCDDTGLQAVSYDTTANNFDCANLSDNAVTITGDWDFGGGGIEVENGTTPPACVEGQLYVDTDAPSGQRLYACETTTFVLQGDGTGGTTAIDALGDAAGVGAVTVGSDQEYGQTWTWNTPATTVGALDALKLVMELDATTDAQTQQILALERADGAGTTALEAILSINNAEVTAAVNDAILIRSAAGTIVDAIDANDAQITNIITHVGGSVTTTDLDIIDDGQIDDTDMAAEDFGEFTCSGSEDGCTIDVGDFLVVGEALTGTKNDVNLAFTIATNPAGTSPDERIDVFLEGFRLTQVATATNADEFHVAGTTVTLALAPSAGDALTATYTF